MRECCGGPSGDRSRSPINVRFTVMVVVDIVIVKLIKKVMQHVPSPQEMVYVSYSRWLWNFVYWCYFVIMVWARHSLHLLFGMLEGGEGRGGGELKKDYFGEYLGLLLKCLRPHLMISMWSLIYRIREENLIYCCYHG